MSSVEIVVFKIAADNSSKQRGWLQTEHSFNWSLVNRQPSTSMTDGAVDYISYNQSASSPGQWSVGKRDLYRHV